MKVAEWVCSMGSLYGFAVGRCCNNACHTHDRPFSVITHLVMLCLKDWPQGVC